MTDSIDIGVAGIKVAQKPRCGQCFYNNSSFTVTGSYCHHPSKRRTATVQSSVRGEYEIVLPTRVDGRHRACELYRPQCFSHFKEDCKCPLYQECFGMMPFYLLHKIYGDEIARNGLSTLIKRIEEKGNPQ